MEEFIQCQLDTEPALSESYAGCDYTEQEWSRLEQMIQLSSFIQCSSQLFSEECEAALTEKFNNWLHQHEELPSPSPSPTDTTEYECNANVRILQFHLQGEKIF